MKTNNNPSEPSENTGHKIRSKWQLLHPDLKAILAAGFGAIIGVIGTLVLAIATAILFYGRSIEKLNLVYENYKQFQYQFDNLDKMNELDSIRKTMNENQVDVINRLDRIESASIARTDSGFYLTSELRKEINNGLDSLELLLSNIDVINNQLNSKLTTFQKSFESFKTTTEKAHLREFENLKIKQLTDSRNHNFRLDELNDSFIQLKDEVNRTLNIKTKTIDINNIQSIEEVISYLDSKSPYEMFKIETLDSFDKHYSKSEKDAFKNELIDDSFDTVSYSSIDGLEINWFHKKISNLSPTDQLPVWIGKSKIIPFVIQKDGEFISNKLSIKYVENLISSNKIRLFNNLHGFDKNNNHYIIGFINEDEATTPYCFISYIR
ncbi:hypothetical protein QQ008_01110 [Fulvivirgaceae bacterium BMA10]|uniref:Uncharacterized protein n=1 Tax=Splendidivirga corallicola TaxID=3051826 RepID=A0ABT8KGU0_9BACT|nr:hypothetical protein [Fulvivirgaceae bacterium BMA10]